MTLELLAMRGSDDPACGNPLTCGGPLACDPGLYSIGEALAELMARYDFTLGSDATEADAAEDDFDAMFFIPCGLGDYR